MNRADPDSSRPELPLVIGIGNDMRGDDAVGLRVVRKLQPLVGNQARIVESPGGVAELLDLWEGRDRVYLVDAMKSGAAPGSWLRVAVGDQPLPSSLASTSTHGLSLASAVALGQVLGRMPKRLVVYGLEAARVTAGDELSPEILDGAGQVIRSLVDEIAVPEPARRPAERV